MNVLGKTRPSPALVVAMIALFVALGGTAGAVATQAVPLAKRALVADNAKKLGGKTPAQIVAQASAQGAQAALSQSPAGPRPASSGVELVTTKAQAVQLGAGGADAFEVTCDTGQKVISGGFVSDNAVIIAVANGPVSESAWGIGLLNLNDGAAANVNVYAVCIR
jgi:hypothetical protein